MSVACEKAKQGQRCINVCLKCQIDNCFFFFFVLLRWTPRHFDFDGVLKMCFSDEVFEVYGVVIKRLTAGRF